MPKTDQRAIVLLADGVEEMEAVISIDVLRRAGIQVRALGITGELFAKGSRGIPIGLDGTLRGDEDAELLVLPGGADGAEALARNETVLDTLRRFEREEHWIAAICAAPAVLVAAGVGKGKDMTSHPSVKDKLLPHAGHYKEDSVVLDPKLVTSRGPGTSFDFALDLVGLLLGPDQASAVRAPMMFPCG